MSLTDALELFQIRLTVVYRARRNVRVENDARLGVDRLMHFVFELQGRPILAGQGGVGVRATMVRVVGNFPLPRGPPGTAAPGWRFLVLLGWCRFVEHQRHGCGVSRNQRGVRHHATFLVDQTLLPAERDDLAEYARQDPPPPGGRESA